MGREFVCELGREFVCDFKESGCDF